MTQCEKRIHPTLGEVLQSGNFTGRKKIRDSFLFSSQSDYFVSTGALEMNLTDNVKIPDLV